LNRRLPIGGHDYDWGLPQFFYLDGAFIRHGVSVPVVAYFLGKIGLLTSKISGIGEALRDNTYRHSGRHSAPQPDFISQGMCSCRCLSFTNIYSDSK
jgi:hypothetical protein